MKNEHIFEILDEKAFADLSAADLSAIESHTAFCPDCDRAFQAARLSSVLLKNAAVEEFVPNAFFRTRVMATLRERQAKMNPFALLGKMWRASSALVVMMMSIVIALAALTIFAPEINGNSSNSSGVFISEGSLTDMVIMNERLTAKEPTNEQIYQLIYNSDAAAQK
jgi:hypothetical protein